MWIVKPAQFRARVFFRSLGCPKNQVDSEVMLGNLALGGYAIAERLEDADVAVINTCSFIETAREESVEAILELAERKQSGNLRALVVAGCLPQRYGRELAMELPEVDLFVGTGRFQNIAELLDKSLEGHTRGVYVDAGRTYLYDEADPRLLIGARHSAYLKLAEGCDRVCAFCAIPGIRGRFQSRAVESVRGLLAPSSLLGDRAAARSYLPCHRLSALRREPRRSVAPGIRPPGRPFPPRAPRAVGVGHPSTVSTRTILPAIRRRL